MTGFALEIIKKNRDRQDKIALIDREGSRKITWDSLLDKICRVAAYAHKESLSGIIPVYMDRGMEAAATILGLNLAGVGVAPLSITTPKSRCETIAKQVGNSVWTLDTYNAACRCKPAYEFCHEGKEADPAYVVFTSGSTGNPKGVLLSNRAILGGMERAAGEGFFDLNGNDRMLQSSSFSFIALAADLLAPLYTGSLIYVLPEKGRGDTRMITDYVNRYGITTLFMSPQLYRTFEGGPSLKCVCIGGDKIINIGPKGHRLVSVYGMTEMAGFAFHYDIKEPMPSTPIGIPCPGINVYILDEEGNESEEGELCVSGSVAHGYFELPELNERTFTPNKFSDDPDHSFLLHSGDIARWLPDGNLKYLNRIDNMIKINGQRVEPGEIEIVLMDYPGIETVAVKGFTDEEQRSILCAYYTCNRTVDETKIKKYLEGKLPHYMVPSIFVKMDQMPLNVNGKLDRKALAMPDLSAFLIEYEAPIGEAEEMLCKAYAKVLGLEKVGRNDDFFRIGGDSIAALKVVGECEALGISTGDIFAGRTPKSIAVLVTDSHKDLYKNLRSDMPKAKLTDSQMGILLECGLHEKRTIYNIPVCISFDRTSDMTADKVKAALDSVIKMHPALYADIVEESSGFYMVRRDFPEGGICEASEENEDDVEAYAASFIQPIALGDDPLCTVKAMLTADRVNVFMNMHHIVSDGTSVAVLCRQFGETLEGKEPKAETVDAFALSEVEKRIKSSSAAADAATYFDNLLGGVEIDSNLVPDHKVKEGSEALAANLYRDIDTASVEAFLEGSDITENTFFMGIFGYVLAKMTGQTDSVFAAAENGRENSLVGDTVSMLVKTLPVVMKIDEEKCAEPLLKELQSQFFATMRNDSMGFGQLAERYDVRTDVMFVYQSDMLNGYDGKDIHMDMEIPALTEALANLSMMINKKGSVYSIKLEYRKDMYEEYTIARFLELYEKMVSMFTKNVPLKDIELISEKDRAFLNAKNKEAEDVQASKNVLEVFRETVRKYPDKTAVICRDVEYTYAQVDDITDRIAAYIHDKGIGRGDVVSVLIPRGEYMLIATMGVLKSGAAYEPLDPAYPAERLSFMVSDAKAKLLIKDRKLDDILKDYEGPKLYLDEIEALPGRSAIDNAGEDARDDARDNAGKNAGCIAGIEPPQPDDMYVLLYTSGTTGTPKGVMLTHRNLSAFMAAHTETLMVDDTSIMANYASYGFDAHMADLYPAITAGATLVIIPDEMRLDLSEVKNYCEKMKVTHLLMTTQVARQFAVQFENVEHLRVIDCGGEKLVSFDPVQNYVFINLYGPSECTVCVTGITVDRYYDNIPIGHALKNSKLYVTDTYGRRMPVGVPGELIICGPQVGAGYLGRPDKTEEVFVPNTCEDLKAPYDRCYKTGDIVRYIESGEIEYIGRRDHQVKIRGFRVELEEVEKAIRDYQGIKDATVSVIDNNGAKSICAYIVADEKIDIADLNSFVGQSHPAYMIPAVTMQIDMIPLTANGKVDKKKLPKPEMHFEDAKKPATELQQKIYDKAVEAIGTDGFGVDTDIFTAGLTSIGSIKLCTLLADELGIPVKMRDLKRYSTVEKLEEFAIRSMGGEVPAKAAPADVAKPEAAPAKAVEYGPAHPITKTMEGIFVECLQRPDSTIYNIPFLLKLGRSVDGAKLKKAIAAAVEAHPCMKAELFSDAEGKICQHRRKEDAYTEDEVTEITLASAADINSSLIKAFKLTDSRLFEISILTAEGDKYLFINIHHIIADGTSMFIFIKDVEKAYAGEEIAEESYSSFDVADEELKARTEEELKYEKEYYASLLNGLDKDFLLLPDRVEDQPEGRGSFTLTQMEADADEIKGYCATKRIGLNAFFVGAFGYTLAKYAGSDYSVFNTVYNGRNDSRRMGTMAMLVKTLPVVCHIDKDKVSEIGAEMSAQLLDTMSNDLYSYAEIAQNFDIKNDVMFIFQGDSFNIDSFCGESAQEIELGLSESKAPMSIQVMIKGGKLVYEVEYDPKRFTEKLMVAFVQALDKAAASFIRTDAITDVSILSEAAQAEMEKYNDTEMDYDKTKTITDHFLATVKAQPEHLCVVYENKSLTFGQVGELTGKLAMFLMKEGIGRGDVVSILIRRDENMVTTAHGVLRTGAAYLGLDPSYPPERLEFMIRDSGSKYLIADRSLMGLIKNYDGKCIYLDEIAGLSSPTEEELAELMAQDKHRIVPEDDAIIIYSSGTTGVPKGSVLRHRNIVCFYHNYKIHIELGPDSRVAQYASFGFDGGAMDVMSSPMSGATLYVVPDDMRLDLSRLEKFYVKNKITYGFMTTQVGCMFVSSTRCKSLKYFFAGGEKLIPVMGPGWVTFRNGYGPSETMCYVNTYTIRNTGSIQPIGIVNNNTKEYIIDKFGNRLPFGACGELCISSGQMGRGYLNRPEKTAEAFVANPFSTKPGYEMMYRTGDVVRMLPDGNYDFVGRRDGQVKIRGFRIELGEVEQQIRKYPGVTKSVVKACDNPSGGKFLAAYVVMDEKLDVDDLREFIGKEKPDYMIPAVIMQVGDIPLTANGKVDMSKLPKPELGAARVGKEPTNETEEKLCQIFAEVVGIDKVYADDDFFKIGGSSISAIQVVVKCEQAGFPVVYKNLFVNPTPQQLAEFIHGGEQQDVTASDLNKNDEHDYSALTYNVLANLPKIDDQGIGDVLLTGSTGFLGSHIFKDIMESTSSKVICLVRSKKELPADIRFESMMTYYFEDWYQDAMKARTVIIDGTLEDDNIKDKLSAYHIDTIINCAANVKHFAVEQELISSNYSGVENLIDFAEKCGARLIQISSLSVGGESVNGSVPDGVIFRECDLNIGQSLENKYIYSKYLAEQAVVDAISKKRIRGKIIRLGNLMARVTDSEFQINATSNGFIRMFMGFKKLGCFPVDMLDAEVEFSPIDRVARAVVLLSGTPDEFTCFHAKNCNTIHYSYMLKAVMDAGYPIEIVENDVFEQRLQNALKEEKNATELAGLLAYRNSTKSSVTDVAERLGDEVKSETAAVRVQIPSSTVFTTKALYRLAFGWPLISIEYLREMVKVLVELDLFE